MIIKSQSFFSILISFLFFFVLFIGNYELYGFRVFYGSVVVFLMYVISYNRFLSTKTISIFIAVVIFNLLLLPVSVDISNYIPGYYHWSIQLSISILIMSAFITDAKRVESTCWMQVLSYLCIFFIAGSLIVGQNSGGRIHFIFGPNVLYRVIGFLAIVSVYYSYAIRKNTVYTVFFIMVYIYTIFLIGSRGGVISSPIIILMLLHCRLVKINYKLLLLMMIFIILSTSVFSYYFSDTRLMSFNTDNEASSVGIRFHVLMYTWNNISSIALSNGMPYSDYYSLFYTDSFMYPHNAFVELVLFYGFSGVILSIFMIYCFFVVMFYFFKSPFSKEHVLFYGLLILFPGILFSGDLNDNASIMGLLLMLYVHRKLLTNTID